MKTILIILFSALFFIYVGKPTVNFKPFSVNFETPYLPFAVFFLILSIHFYCMQYEKIGYKNGVNDTVKIVEKIVNEKK